MSLRNPVQYPVKHYAHTDTDAPQYTNIDGAIKTILKACLVTGYGGKAGAGWTALFEDANRIILRRPLRTGTPPDIKIENGVIAGTASHRIVSQDNPTGLDDANELAAVNLLARDSAAGNEWHLVVSDFGFVLCYQLGEQGYGGDRNALLVCSSAQKLNNTDADHFVCNEHPQTYRNGTANAWLNGLMSANCRLKNMRTGTVHTNKGYLTANKPEQFTGDYLAQPIMIDSVALLPFYTSVSSQYDDKTTKTVTIKGRQMLRYVNKPVQQYYDRAFYIPLDYWVL